MGAVGKAQVRNGFFIEIAFRPPGLEVGRVSWQ